MASTVERRRTAEITAESNLRGQKLYEVRARKALPLLVRQAKAEQPIFYSDLASELEMPNPRNLNFVLGTIGNALQKLGQQWSSEIPPIQCLVINKHTRMPGEGVAWFLSNRVAYERSSNKQKRQLLQQILTDVFRFERWNEVLASFNLESVEVISPRVPSIHKRGGTGESEEHKRLKEFIAQTPRAIGLSVNANLGQTEYEFPSGDILDILFTGEQEWVGVEVKSKKSNPEDITRGVYQCVKYRALVEAIQMVQQRRPNSRIILVLEDPFPADLLGLKNTLGVEVMDGVGIS